MTPETSVDRELVLRLARGARRLDAVLGPIDPRLLQRQGPRLQLVSPGTQKHAPTATVKRSRPWMRYCAAAAAVTSTCASLGMRPPSVAAAPATTRPTSAIATVTMTRVDAVRATIPTTLLREQSAATSSQKPSKQSQLAQLPSVLEGPPPGSTTQPTVVGVTFAAIVS